MRNAAAVLFTAMALAACGGDDDDGDGNVGGFDDRQIIIDFADQVVIPTYELLDERSGALDAAARTLADDPGEENLEATRQGWVELRQPWEQSEGFLFGPVDSQGWDPAMDTWPLNKDDLDNVLASSAELTQEYISNLQESQKGFHTVEYLLWGQDSRKTADQLTARPAGPREWAASPPTARSSPPPARTATRPIRRSNRRRRRSWSA
jgi:uncharacterized iron-regulated protein